LYLERSHTDFVVWLATHQPYQVLGSPPSPISRPIHAAHSLTAMTLPLHRSTPSTLPCRYANDNNGKLVVFHAIMQLPLSSDPQMYAKSFFSSEAYHNTYTNAILHPEHDNFNQDPFHLTDPDAPHLSNLDDSDSESNNLLLSPKT